jgi:hypothetical protein
MYLRLGSPRHIDQVPPDGTRRDADALSDFGACILGRVYQQGVES